LPAADVVPRDHRKLRVFVRADDLALRVYHVTRMLPVEERYGLQSQTRRAALSVAGNIVEGCARRTDKEYGHFVSIALGSAAETCYLFSVIRRLRMLPDDTCTPLENDYETLLKGLNKLLTSIDGFE
jgi:four helix bundle protein